MAFAVVFGIFVVLLAILGFVAVRWGIRRDRPGRAEWRRRYLEGTAGESAANGSMPDSSRGALAPPDDVGLP